MAWNWQQSGWPAFVYDSGAMADLEQEFLRRSGEFIGAFKHVVREDQEALKIELIGDEALKTSEIEGEVLDRESVQSSLRQQFGLDSEQRRIPPAERGIAQMMVSLYHTFAEPLTHETMLAWHRMLMSGERHVSLVGGYRTHSDAMQIVFGSPHDHRVYFEAPPSAQMWAEMAVFIAWFNESRPGGKTGVPALTRAGIAHLHFVSIHPFEDGNGRIARALAEKSLAQSLGYPSLIALAYTIERARKAYYDVLARNNKAIEVTDWLVYFGDTILAAQRNTIRRVDFCVAKARLHARLRGQLNDRQEKAIARMFREGVDGFKGGLGAEKYIRITGASRATATRDLQDLAAKGALRKTGALRHTRYHLNIPFGIEE